MEVEIFDYCVELAYNGEFKFRLSKNSSVVARENSSVVALGNSSVVAWGNSSVEARENSSVEAWGFSFIRQLSIKVKITKKSDFITKVSTIRKFKKDTIVYKKCLDGIIAALLCEKGQEFQSERGSKCRTSKAKVLGFYNSEKEKLDLDIAYSSYDESFAYELNKVDQRIITTKTSFKTLI